MAGKRKILARDIAGKSAVPRMRDPDQDRTVTRRSKRKFVSGALAGALLALAGSTSANELACGALENAFGPIDYRTASQFDRDLVEKAHFTAPVESLTAGHTAALPGGDLDYTLRVFPNHPRALAAVSRYSIQRKQPKPPGLRWPVDCYFDRAFRFQPDDPMPVMLFGVYLARTGRATEASEVLSRAADSKNDDPNFHYNLGLGFFEVKDYKRAYQHAKRAYDGGFPLPGLRNRLREVGAWKE
jgi:hypothetical protein